MNPCYHLSNVPQDPPLRVLVTKHYIKAYVSAFLFGSLFVFKCFFFFFRYGRKIVLLFTL